MRNGTRVLCLLFFGAAVACATAERAPLPAGWYKGNTHAHSLWSDGDAAPEVAAGWYKSHGYQFLVLAEVEGPEAACAFKGDEFHVRATVVSSRPHPNPFKAGDVETAWVQPVVPGK